ncbi:ABC1 domain protein [Pseudovirgaria hyperparasitica]|uniref:ABC1 domain protein n=1 Tax=Pseudovirgaria hyperparasitica TaxID=470096 RepID=A0A6A6W4B1_9PEZI|nr:ABC1 domain protein [Pseudovirgaria hyperparasitica]KAF2757395.1 ABC1 domain protein [Pseudovirgaria hyperparasitica]
MLQRLLLLRRPQFHHAISIRHAVRPPVAISQALKQPQLRRNLQSAQFSPLVPPDPSKLPKPKPKKVPNPKRSAQRRKWRRRLLYTAAFIGAVYVIDRQYYASAIGRTVRTFYTGLYVGIDYKINFRPNPPFAGSIADVHRRNAERMFNLLRENGGLYLKIGQAIAMQSAVLPPEFQKMFAKMFDDAPQNDWKDVERVIREDFGGKSVEEVFGVSFTGEPGKGVMERTARASASVAQVHWARLADGREVAIKVQKEEIMKQVGWDLWSFKVVARIYSWWFDIPFYSVVPYVTERLMLETDFENEANNASMMRGYVQGEPRLRNRVYIPKVYTELSSKRVMTAEWIEGIRLWDKEGITGTWKGGWGKGSPGCNGQPLGPPPPPADTITRIPNNDPNKEKLKPERTAWRGKDGSGGLGLSLKSVMTTMVDLFSAQMFLWGAVHCDPHPGNIFVRRLPGGKPELVLIDHGLYITMRPEFRHQYALLWKSLLAFDNKTMQDVVSQWGITGTGKEMFASATLMRPYEGGDNQMKRDLRELSKLDERERQYEMQRKMRENVRSFLSDDTKLPMELLFIGRNLRIVQGNNQFLGSPVNRIKITGLWASRALAEDSTLPLTQRIKFWVRHLTFRMVLLGSDVVWWYARIRQLAGLGKGMDDEIEERMRTMAKDYGVELNHGVFDG